MSALKSRVQSASNEAEDARRREYQATQQVMQDQRQAVDEAQETAKTWIEQKKAAAASEIDQWKARREAKKLSNRADQAEEYAAAAIALATASISEAENAVLEAVIARMDAAAVAV